jgi:hypothetical protein
VAAGVGVPSAAGAVSGARTRVQDAVVKQRAALLALQEPGGRSYQRALTNVDAALADLRAAKSTLATRARQTGSFPHIDVIQQLLDQALGAENIAATLLTEEVLLVRGGAPATTVPIALLRSRLREGLSATTGLAKLTDGL